MDTQMGIGMIEYQMELIVEFLGGVRARSLWEAIA